MKALYFKQHGEIDNLIYGEFPSPTSDETSAIIKVLYSSLNHLDLWILNGWSGLNLDLPHVGGADIVGTVETAPKDSLLKSGDLVCVNPGYVKHDYSDRETLLGRENLSKGYGIFGEDCKGGFATLVKAPINCIHKITNINESKLPELAASLLVGLTSYRMLEGRAKLNSGESLLVVGAGGGVNSFTIKLAKYLGANVIALTGTEEKGDLSLKLGADNVINYNQNPDWHRDVKKLTDGRGVDVVIDNVGSTTINKSIRSCAIGGRIITVGNTSGHELKIDNRHIFTKQISIIGSTMGSFSDFKNILDIIIKREIFAPIHKTIPLEEGKLGYKSLKDKTRFGKIVFKNQ